MLSQLLSRRPIMITAAVVAMFLPRTSVRATSIDDAVNLIARNVLEYLEDQGKKELFVDQFKGPKTSGGRLIESRVRERLKTEGVTILKDDLEASWTLRGQLSTDTSGKSAIMAVQVELFDAGGNSKGEFRNRFREDIEVLKKLEESLPPEKEVKELDPRTIAVIDGSNDVSRLAATTQDTQSEVEKLSGTKAEGSPQKLDGSPSVAIKKAQEIQRIPTSLQKQALENPSFFADGATLVRASSASKFALEIRVSDNENGPFIPVAVEDKGGRAFVPLLQDQFFQVHVTNDGPFDVGLELRMDGINTMEFAEGTDPGFREDGKWLIKAGTRSAAIKGWFINPTKVDRFIIKAEPDGVAAALGRPHSIGTIQATFFMARTTSQGPSQFASLLGNARNAVGRGASTDFDGTMEVRTFENGNSLASIALL
ncbi:MAG: hypothetical protein KDA89_24125 [Planctomycetaceae bacterium]|nr:hypothetical protein [Planctomycetaceae bacterium]